MYEFLENHPETWRVYPAPDRDEAFDKALLDLAGTNPHGEPVLRVVWGGTQLTDRTKTGHELKYHCGWTKSELKGFRYEEDGETKFIEDANEYTGTSILKPVIEQDPVGYPRWIIEKWVSPAELDAAKRFKGDTKLLKDFPREGVYEAYFVVEDANANFRPLGRDVLNFIKLKWQYEHNVRYEQRESDRRDYIENEEAEKKKRSDIIWDPDNHFKLPHDEQERRALMEENRRRLRARAVKEAKQLKFYGTGTTRSEHSADGANRR